MEELLDFFGYDDIPGRKIDQSPTSERVLRRQIYGCGIGVGEALGLARVVKIVVHITAEHVDAVFHAHFLR
jgi:hypothetical protein